MKITEATNKKEWDTFITTKAPQSYFQAWEWGEIESESEKKVWRLKMSLPKTQSIAALSLVVKVKARRGTFLHVRHGPVVKKWDSSVFGKWLDFIVELGKKEGARFIRLSPMIDRDMESFMHSFHLRSAPIHNMDAEVVRVLDLSKSYESLLAQMRKTTRNLIRRAKKEEVVIKYSDDIDTFLSLYKTTASRHHFVPHNQIASEFRHFKKDGNATILTGFHKNKPLASAVIVGYGNQAMYLHGASVRSKVPAAYLVQWGAISWAKTRRFELYNFWGIADTDRDSHPWRGLSQFKLGFGGNTKRYLHAQDLPLTPLYYITYAIESIRKIKRGY